MSDKKLGQEPARPCEIGFIDGKISQEHQNGNTTALHNGNSKRFDAAKDILCALISSNKYTVVHKDLVKTAYELTDELLKQENL